VAVSDEIAEVSALVEPWLWVQTTRRQYLAFKGVPVGPYGFGGIVKGDGTVSRNVPPAAVRAELLVRAEAVLAALDGAGWQLAEYPEMSFWGDLTAAVVTDGGNLVAPAEQHSISLRMDFEVMRP
jgi:hypothetical protein